jgi:hypothetical protein
MFVYATLLDDEVMVRLAEGSRFMNSRKREQILLVIPTNNSEDSFRYDIGQVYEAMLRSEGYTPQICANWEVFPTLRANPLPHLIVWYVDPHVYEDISKTLRQIHQMYNESERPSIFLLVSTIDDMMQSKPLADKVKDFLIGKDEFISIVENLLLDKGRTNALKPN